MLQAPKISAMQLSAPLCAAAGKTLMHFLNVFPAIARTAFPWRGESKNKKKTPQPKQYSSSPICGFCCLVNERSGKKKKKKTWQLRLIRSEALQQQRVFCLTKTIVRQVKEVFHSGRHQRRYSVSPAVSGLSLLAFGQAGNSCMQDSDLRSAAWDVENLGVGKHFGIACEWQKQDMITLLSVCVKTNSTRSSPPSSLYLCIWFSFTFCVLESKPSKKYSQNHNCIPFHLDSFPPPICRSLLKKEKGRWTHIFPSRDPTPPTFLQTLKQSHALPQTLHPTPLVFIFSLCIRLLCSSAKPNKPAIKMSEAQEVGLGARQQCLQGASQVSAALWCEEHTGDCLSLGKGPAPLHWLTRSHSPHSFGQREDGGWRQRGRRVQIYGSPSEYLFPPLIILACLLLQPVFIPAQIKAWKAKLNLSNRSGDERHPWMVGSPGSHPGLHFQWPPPVKLGHIGIVLHVRANPKRSAWFWAGSSAVRQEDQFPPPNTPICVTSLQKRFNFSQAWLGGFQCVHSARSQQRQTLLFSLQLSGRQELWEACARAHARSGPHFNLIGKVFGLYLKIVCDIIMGWPRFIEWKTHVGNALEERMHVFRDGWMSVKC